MSDLVDVILPLAIRDTYTYALPPDMPMPPIGSRVLVPLAKKVVIGIVLQPHSTPLSPDITIREVIQLLDPFPIITPQQLRLWQWMASYYMCPLGDVMAAALPAKALDHHYSMAESKRRRVVIDHFDGTTIPKNALNAPQQEAFKHIQTQFECHDIVLLQGVTSSGKTEIYIHLIEEQLRLGHQVLYLVPEIALTTQLTDRLQRIFGTQLRVYHSRISDAQRMEIYRQQLLDHSPRLIVGARSAVFLPMHNLGLIIMDEEHESSYKQQEPAPRYHARAVAAMMASHASAKLLLGSATPSIESRFLAERGKYGYVTLTQRYQGLQLPAISLIDLKQQYHRKEMYMHFSDPLVLRIRQELEQKKQIILFLNRRGYAPYIQCTQCGHIPTCSDCNVSLTYHRRGNMLVCHYCGRSYSVPTRCPKCGGEMKLHGFGTERLEEEVTELFPDARVARMDLDSTLQKNRYLEIINDFQDRRIDILVGTQMVTKGLDFDNVSVVGVVSADNLIYFPDFRAFERAFQQMTQVSGRAGRHGHQGKVIIQTFNPYHQAIRNVIDNDYKAMYDSQITERRVFRYPPYSRLIDITLKHRDSELLNDAAARFATLLQQVFATRVIGPEYPNVSRVRGLYIKKILMRFDRTEPIAEAKKIIIATGARSRNLPNLPQDGKHIIMDIADKLKTDKQLSSLQIHFDVDPQ